MVECIGKTVEHLRRRHTCSVGSCIGFSLLFIYFFVSNSCGRSSSSGSGNSGGRGSDGNGRGTERYKSIELQEQTK